MEILSTIISLVDLYSKVSGILKGDSSKQVLNRIATGIEKLSDNILYAPNIQVVQQLNQPQQRFVTDLREVRQYLEPIQQVVGGQILSSSMILSPEKMQVALKRNPWEVLDHIRPATLVTPHSNPDMVPVLFSHSNIQYIGWQLRGALPMLFDCKYEDIWTPTGFSSRESILSDVSNELFPLHNVSLGETTKKDLEKMGESRGDGNTFKYFVINGVNFWYHTERLLAESMYLTHNEKMPEKWEKLGLNWQLSFDEWFALLKKLGYEVQISKLPKVITQNLGSGNYNSFEAELMGLKKSKRTIQIQLQFNYSHKTSRADKGTLYSLRVVYVPES